MDLTQGWANPSTLALRALFLLRLDLSALKLLLLRLGWLALHDKRNRAHDGLILAIGDVISHGFLHEVPSSLVPETNFVLDRPRLSGANGTEFQIGEIEISGLACSGRPG
jgi:hypothetical protein